MINENLSWKPHIDKIASKILKTTGVINRLKHILPVYILRTLYCSLIQSNLNYAILAWGFECEKLNKVQKRAIRVITCSRYNAHTEPLFKHLELLKISDIFKLNILKFYYKLSHLKVPHYFQLFNTNRQGDIHGRETRFNYLLPINVTRLQLSQKCLRNYLPYILNMYHGPILEKVETHSFNGFSGYAKNKIINGYQVDCQISNCYICGS